jgi:site-specific recombinase XerD
MINMGLDLADIQDHLGHKKIDSTLVYAKLLNPRKTRNALLAESSHHVARF